MKTLNSLILIAVAFLLTAGDAEAQGLRDLKGQVIIDGSSTVAPISMKAADWFAEKCPNVKVPVGISGTGGGFKRFTKNETDISDASRPIKKAEFEQCRKNDVSFIEIPVAYDGLTIIVSKENNWLDRITVDQLKQIFSQSTAAKKWSDVDSSWPNEEIKIFAPGTDSGTFDYFKEVVIGKEGSVRDDMSVSEDDNQIVQGVAQNRTSIGFFGAAYYFENTDKLKALKVVNPKTNKAVLPTAETIENGDYAPFSRPLFIYVNRKSYGRPEVKVFVEHYLENAPKMAEAVGYVPLPKKVYEIANLHIKRRMTGTHFLTSDGEKRAGSLEETYTTDNLVK